MTESAPTPQPPAEPLKQSPRRLSPEWRKRLRLTVLILVFFTVVAVLTARIYIASDAQSVEDFAAKLERYKPVRILDK